MLPCENPPPLTLHELPLSIGLNRELLTYRLAVSIQTNDLAET